MMHGSIYRHKGPRPAGQKGKGEVFDHAFGLGHRTRLPAMHPFQICKNLALVCTADVNHPTRPPSLQSACMCCSFIWSSCFTMQKPEHFLAKKYTRPNFSHRRVGQGCVTAARSVLTSTPSHRTTAVA
jgi:hypothetical protein